MPWPTFLFWNAAGGIGWAISVAVAAYVLGEAAFRVIHEAGLVGIALVAVAGLVLFVVLRRRG
jgi:membrane protein DedA with SNARE-associated domain